MSYFVQLVNQTDGARQDQQRKPIKSKFRGTHLLSGLFNKISEMGKTVKSGNLTLFSGVPGIAFVHTTILEMLQIPRKLSVEKADKRQETYDTPL